MKETIYIGLRGTDGMAKVLKNGQTTLRPVGSTLLFSDPRGLDWTKTNELGQRRLAVSILFDFIEDENKAELLAPAFVKTLIQDLDDRGYTRGWTITASMIYDFLGVDVSNGTGHQADKETTA